MILPSYRIDDFINTVIKNNDYMDVIYLAEKEATEAERKLYHPGLAEKAVRAGVKKYTKELKYLLWYLRFNIKPSVIYKDYEQLFSCVTKSLREKKHLKTRILPH